MNFKKLSVTTILSLVTGALLFSFSVKAATVSIIIDREYTVSEDANVRVVENRVVRNNTTDRSITKENNYEVFTITALYEDENNSELLEDMVATAVVRGEGGWNLNYSVEYKDNSALITVPYPESIPAGSSYTFSFEYTNHQLAQKSGALFDVYIQAFSEDFSFLNGNVEYIYNTTLKIPRSLGDENFVIPEPADKSISNGYDVYQFNQNQLIGTYVWVQRGVVQYYKFNISQEISATEEINTGNINEYKMVLPRSLDAVKTNQRILFTNITPKPDYVEQDMDGNIIGVFKFRSNLDTTIRIEGYAVVETRKDFDVHNSGTLSEAQSSLSPVYTSEAAFWEVDAPEIQQKADELSSGKDSVFEVLNTTYTEIVETIDYSQVKRFGLNQRQGALKTLQGGAAVCMEYSDLYIALLRAQGIPARAAFGYGYDSKDPADGQELHQWAQAYIPTQNKWLNIDVTWGENGPALIGGDMNHFLTHVASVNPNDPATLSGRTFGDSADFSQIDFSIEVVDVIPDIDSDTVEDILAKYPVKEESRSEEVISSFSNKFNAGIVSIMEDGINLQNSAQIIVLSTSAIILIILIVLVTTIIKLINRRKIENNLHSLRGTNSKKV